MPSVFIVDDHQDTADALAAFLESCGYTVEAYSDFKTAEYKIVRDHPGIVFTDFHMFGDILTAPEFIERIRAHFPRLKIVIVSGDPLKKSDALQLGVEFLLKPVDLDYLKTLCAFSCHAKSA